MNWLVTESLHPQSECGYCRQCARAAARQAAEHDRESGEYEMFARDHKARVRLLDLHWFDVITL